MADVIDKKTDPSNPSGDYLAMIDDWSMISDIMAGLRRIKEKQETYLPRYEDESNLGYKFRLDNAPWRPVFEDAHRTLCSKPFTKEVALAGEVPARIKEFAEDVDGEGNNLNVFAKQTFKDGVAKGLEAIYVTFPKVDPAATATVAAERKSGVRPYWTHVCADDLIDVKIMKVRGKERIYHIRFRETEIERDGYEEVTRRRVREINHPEGAAYPDWTLWERTENKGKVEWVVKDEGLLLIDQIPVVLYFTGERSGAFRVRPPLLALANMQIEIYRGHAREEEILTYAGSPMLKAVGMHPPKPTVQRRVVNGVEQTIDIPAPVITLGPKRILWAGIGQEGVAPDFDWIQPAAANIAAVSENVKNKIAEFKSLAMQPSVPRSGTPTATGEAVSAAKANSAIQEWANALKDALEQAFVFTCMWIKEKPTVEVFVHTDYGIDIGGSTDCKDLAEMQKNGQISLETMFEEQVRRSFFGPQFDKDKEPERIAKDREGREPPSTNVDPFSGRPVQ